MATAKVQRNQKVGRGRHENVVAPNLEQWNNESVVPSGCMRGNDKPANNGSASAGIYPVYEEHVHEEISYKDFIHLNYGYKISR